MRLGPFKGHKRAPRPAGAATPVGVTVAIAPLALALPLASRPAGCCLGGRQRCTLPRSMRALLRSLHFPSWMGRMKAHREGIDREQPCNPKRRTCASESRTVSASRLGCCCRCLHRRRQLLPAAGCRGSSVPPAAALPRRPDLLGTAGAAGRLRLACLRRASRRLCLCRRRPWLGRSCAVRASGAA